MRRSRKPNQSAGRDSHDNLGVTTNRINILLVDDEPKNLTVLETVLTNPAYRLVRAESADQALLTLVSPRIRPSRSRYPDART